MTKSEPMKQTIKGFLALLIGIIISFGASAQVTTSSISGRVVDQDGGALAGAAVVAVHAPSGTQYYSVANDKGRFNISGMRTGGPYSVEVSFLGMGTVTYEGLVLSLGEPYSIEVNMKPSDNLDAAVLSVDRSLLSNLTGAGSNYGLSTIEEVPTIDRSVYDVVKLSPFVSQVGKGLTFVGTNNRYNNFMIDGAEANDSFGLNPSGTNGGMTGANPIAMDALEEVQVSIAPFDVRQSGFTGGAINAVTKSGTNEEKGSAYVYFNNQDFIGVTPGKNVNNRERYQKQTSQVYGFTVGAPIVKDKLFIFVSAEYDRNSTPNIYTPLNGSYGEQKDYVDADGNNHYFFNTENAEKILAHYKSNFASDVAGFNEGINPRQCVSYSLNALTRIDWNINEKHKLMFRYQFLNAKADKYTSNDASYWFENSGYKLNTSNNIAVLELNSRISDMVTNEFRASAVIVRENRSIAYKGASVKIIGFENLTSDGVNIGPDGNSGANEVNTDTYNVSDNVSVFAGNHHMTFGTNNDFYVFNNLFLQNPYGKYEYSSIDHFLANDLYRYRYTYADPTLKGVTGTTWSARAYAAKFGVYAQDEWTPNRNFILTYGIRADIPVMFNKPTENKAFNETSLSQVSGESIGVVPSASVLVSPRVGFRWFIDKQHKSLLRGGAGIFTGRVPFVWLVNAYNNTGIEIKSIDKKNVGVGLPTTSNPYVDIIEAGVLPSSTSSTVNTLSKKLKYPQTFRANIGFEQDFGSGWNFVFDAVYSKSFNNVFFNNVNLVRSSSTGAAMVSAEAAEKNPASVLTYYDRVLSDYSNVIALENTNLGYSYSLSGQLTKSFDFGLDLMASYTFGHSYSVSDGLASVALTNHQAYVSTDVTAPALAYSYFDKPHKVTGMISYVSPVYARMQTHVSFVYQGQSGNRYSYMTFDSSDVNNCGAGGFLLYVPTKEEVGQMSWSGDAAAQAAAFEKFISEDKYLSSRRGQFTERFAGISPFENRFDLHIAQDFYYDRKGGRKIQLIADLINIGNLLNPEWGLVDDYSSTYHQYRQVLNIPKKSVRDEGNYKVPTYQFIGGDLSIEDFPSRWRCQIGLRVTF